MKQSDAADVFAHLLRICAADLPEPEREYRFCERRWRFDFAWSGARVAVEVNGGRYAFAGGRHASDGDNEKLRRAAALGWQPQVAGPLRAGSRLL